MIRTTIVTIALGCALAGCGQVRQDTPISPALDSGVTSSNGGGTRTLGNVNSTTLGPNGGQTGSNNSQGRAY